MSEKVGSSNKLSRVGNFFNFYFCEWPGSEATSANVIMLSLISTTSMQPLSTTLLVH